MCLAVPVSAIAQVSFSVTEPAMNGSNQVSPITISAATTLQQRPSGWGLYVDNELVTQNTDPSEHFNFLLNASPGIHNVVVRTWDDSGKSFFVSGTINVTAAPFPTLPNDAVPFRAIQQEAIPPDSNWGMWMTSDGGDSGSYPGSSGASGFSFGLNNPLPNLSGSAMALLTSSTSSAVPFWNTLGYRHLGCPSGGCAARRNFFEDMWFFIPDLDPPDLDTTFQATEYDPGVIVNNRKFYASMQCDSNSGQWRFWNGANNSWMPNDTANGNKDASTPTYACDILKQRNVWHHYQLYVTMDYAANKVTYQTFAVDGSVVYQNIANTYDAPCFYPPQKTGSSCGSADSTINIEQQIDNRVATTPSPHS